MIRGYQFLSAKPMLVVLNLSEDRMGQEESQLAPLRAKYASAGLAFAAFSGKVEMELAQLPEEEAAAFMEEYGLSESALTRIIRSAYELLGLISFLTCGEDECRAWTVRRGATARGSGGSHPHRSRPTLYSGRASPLRRFHVSRFHGRLQGCRRVAVAGERVSGPGRGYPFDPARVTPSA